MAAATTRACSLRAPRDRARVTRDGLVAGAIAGAVSGLPSTIWELARGGEPLAATLAAGSILLPDGSRRWRLLAAAPVHAAVSLSWGVLLAHALPRRNTPAAGAAAGLVIAALDLGIVGRRFPRIRRLPRGPQVADHVAFGATVGWVLARRR